jgi:NADPH-dependent 2,4-dienoyl-CoA reductase/sulfur reductase-like enzyme
MTTPPLPRNFRAAYAKFILSQYLLEKYKKQHPDATHLPSRNFTEPDGQEDAVPHGRICIVGAGAAGLAVAISFIQAGITDIDIYEASDRVGGRVFTYTFPESEPDGVHNYYDIGAMRIPQIDAMLR